MNARVIKYNPAFLSEDELIQSFVARHKELDSIIKVIGENNGNSNQHLLVIGARGLGKTSLVLRVAAEIRNNKNLSDKWYPLVFAEESYQVSTPGEFWLEAIFHLAQQTKDNCWEETFKELGKETNEVSLRERALGRLLDFADEQGKRILLIVENFNMLLGDQISDNNAWVLRQTLQNEPRIMLLATATSRFKEIDNTDKAMFDLFKLYELYPLSDEECRLLWKAITGEGLPDKQIRPIKILTGGNPRLLTILASFGAKLSFRELMNELIQLVDGHTEYFKNHLDSLPSVERKAYVALLEIWKPATANEISKAARFSTSKTSAYLDRLVNRGAVVVEDEQSRKKWYQVAERMYNIYFLMRRRGGASGQIKALVNFMVDFYKPEDLINLTQRIAEEACKLPNQDRKEHYLAYEAIQNSIPDEVCEKIIGKTPYAFFTNAPDSLKDLVENKKTEPKSKIEEAILEINRLVVIADKLSEKSDQSGEAERLIRKAIKLNPEYCLSWAYLGKILQKIKCYKEAEQAYRKAVELDPDNFTVLIMFGFFLHMELRRYKEAEQIYRKAIESKVDDPLAWAGKAFLLLKVFNQPEESLEAVKGYLDDNKTVEKTIDDVIDLFVVLAAMGYGKQALDVLRNSPSAAILEPLVVGLQLFVGEDVKAAVEIMEVAQDVAAKIKVRSEQLKNSKK